MDSRSINMAAIFKTCLNFSARVLLPGMDHPVRSFDVSLTNFGSAVALDELEYVNFLKREMVSFTLG